ncbi:MAG: hypothetical protein J6P93_03880 [Alphaproteobacteria bacterium]|nr:hypothetical protein [Alphaproteobacteria bacterium]
MRKLLIVGLALALTACAAGEGANTSNATLNACLTQKAYAALNDGSLMNTEISKLAKNISKTCIQQLALQKAGLDQESVTAATNVLNMLKSSKTKK